MIRNALQFLLLFLSKLFNINNLKVCRFHPSCTVYACSAIQTHSLPKAIWLIAKRLLRCRPGGGWGSDPLPEK